MKKMSSKELPSRLRIISCQTLLTVGLLFVVLYLLLYIKFNQDHDSNNPVALSNPQIAPSNLTATPREKYKLLIFIVSIPEEKHRRTVLRKRSWAGYPWTDGQSRPILSWKHVFVLGRPRSKQEVPLLVAESRRYGDLLFWDHEESYQNLVLKVLFTLYHAVDTYDFDYLMKADTDSFINISLLDEFLTNLNDTPYFYGGRLFVRKRVIREGPNSVPKDAWQPEFFPIFCGGGGYILGSDSVREILRVHESGVQPLFYVEDTYVAALAQHSGVIRPQHIRGFYWHFSAGCKSRDTILLHHIKNDTMMEDLMTRWSEGKSYC